MGLTIHYKLATQRHLNLAAVGQLIGTLRTKAGELGFARVGNLIPAGPHHVWLYYLPAGARTAREMVPAHDGWFFAATPGDGCESLTVGLCRFAGAPGWRLEAFCKTQYASRHGWEHFLKCHQGVIEMLRAAETLSLRVQVVDEGGFWETGSLAVLRRNLAKYDSGIAAFGGALRDAASAEGQTVDGPIFNHPQFEHLEATGMATHSGQIKCAVATVKRLTSPRARRR